MKTYEVDTMAHEGKLDARGFRFAIVISRFNSFVTDRLLEGALDGLKRHGADDGRIEIFRVPGAFEIPACGKARPEEERC